MSSRFLSLLVLPVVLARTLAAAPSSARWLAAGQPAAAGVGRTVECAGRGCPANPPETGPACWWFSYEITPAGSAGRLACLSPGNHYLDGMQGLKISIAAGAEPPALIDPLPLPDPDAPPPSSAPAERDFAPVKYLLGFAGLSALFFFWLRPRWPVWRLRRAAVKYARAPSAETLEILAHRIRAIHPRIASGQSAPLNDHLRELDAARFGGGPLPARTLAFFSGGAKTRLGLEAG